MDIFGRVGGGILLSTTLRFFFNCVKPVPDHFKAFSRSEKCIRTNTASTLPDCHSCIVVHEVIHMKGTRAIAKPVSHSSHENVNPLMVGALSFFCIPHHTFHTVDVPIKSY